MLENWRYIFETIQNSSCSEKNFPKQFIIPAQAPPWPSSVQFLILLLLLFVIDLVIVIFIVIMFNSSAGSSLALLDAVLDGVVGRGFALVRPPAQTIVTKSKMCVLVDEENILFRCNSTCSTILPSF